MLSCGIQRKDTSVRDMQLWLCVMRQPTTLIKCSCSKADEAVVCVLTMRLNLTPVEDMLISCKCAEL